MPKFESRKVGRFEKNGHAEGEQTKKERERSDKFMQRFLLKVSHFFHSKVFVATFPHDLKAGLLCVLMLGIFLRFTLFGDLEDRLRGGLMLRQRAALAGRLVGGRVV